MLDLPAPQARFRIGHAQPKRRANALSIRWATRYALLAQGDLAVWSPAISDRTAIGQSQAN